MKRHKKSFLKNVQKISASILHEDKVSILKVLRDWFNSSEDYEEYNCAIVGHYYNLIKDKLFEINFIIQGIKVYKVDNFFVCTYVVKARDVYREMIHSGQSSSGDELILYTAAIVFNGSCVRHNHCGILHAR